jgi:hypothetical protein
VESLTDEQAVSYGKFDEEPTRPELERSFFLDGEDRKLIAKRRGGHSRLGFALRMCTVRHIGRFLPDDPLDAPWVVVEHPAAQFGIEDVSCVKAYTERKPTAYERAWEIRDAYEYREYEDAEWPRRFRAFLHGRAWTHAEGPAALFSQAVGRLRRHRALGEAGARSGRTGAGRRRRRRAGVSVRSRSDQSVTGRHSASRATMSRQARCACRGW